MELPNAAEILPTVALKKKQGTESDNTYNCPILIYYFWKAIAPEPSNKGTPKVGTQSVKGL